MMVLTELIELTITLHTLWASWSSCLHPQPTSVRLGVAHVALDKTSAKYLSLLPLHTYKMLGTT